MRIKLEQFTDDDYHFFYNSIRKGKRVLKLLRLYKTQIQFMMCIP